MLRLDRCARPGQRRRLLGGAAEHGDEHGEAQCPTDLLHHVDQPGGGTGVGRVDPVQGCGGQRHEREAVAGPEQHQRREQLEVSAGLGEPGQQQETDRGHGDAVGHERLGTHPLHQHPGTELGGREQHDREGQERESRLDGAVAQDVLEELGEEEEHPHHPGHQQQPSDVGRGAVAVGEQPQRHDRCLGAALDTHEHPEQDGAADERGDRGRGGPAVRGGVDEAVDQRDHPDRRGDRSRRVELPAPTGGLGEHGPHQDHQQHPDGHVDEEDPPPRRPLHQGPTGHEADGAAADGHRGVQAEGPQALLRCCERRHQQRERRRRRQRGPHALHRPGHQQHGAAASEPAHQGGGGEQGDAGHERAAAAQQVAGARPEQQQPAEDERVRVDHPRQVGGAEAQRRPDVGERDVHDADVEHDHQLHGEDGGERHRRVGEQPGAPGGGTGRGS